MRLVGPRRSGTQAASFSRSWMAHEARAQSPRAGSIEAIRAQRVAESEERRRRSDERPPVMGGDTVGLLGRSMDHRGSPLDAPEPPRRWVDDVDREIPACPGSRTKTELYHVSSRNSVSYNRSGVAGPSWAGDGDIEDHPQGRMGRCKACPGYKNASVAARSSEDVEPSTWRPGTHLRLEGDRASAPLALFFAQPAQPRSLMTPRA